MLRRKRSNPLIAVSILFAANALAADVSPDAQLTDSAPSPLKVSAIDHALFSNARDPYDADAKSTNAIMNEALVRAEYDPYSLAVHISNRYAPDQLPGMAQGGTRAIVLEKKTATADWTNLNVTLGDSHQEFGRGLALSLYQDKVFGVDYTVEGASARFHPSGVDVTAFGGRINALSVPVAINPLTSALARKNMILGGASAKVDVAKDTKASAHYFYAMSRPTTATEYDRRYQTAGATLSQENIFDAVDAYAESNVLMTDRLADSGATTDALPKGYATYGSVTWSPMPWTVKLEGKDFREYAWELRRPPTLEEDVVHDPNTSNITAARLYVEHRNAETRTVYYGSYLGGDERTLNGTLNHAVLGTKFLGPSFTEFELKGGYRWVTGAETLYHASAKGKIKTFKGQAFELGLRKQYDHFQFADPTDRNMIDVGYTFSDNFNVAMGFEYVPYEVTGKDFVNVGATYKTGGLVSKAFVGKTSGGTLCSGGVCRVVPPYTGAMLETTYTF